MSAKTKISWCDATWSPVRGCSRVSRGCENCYAERMAARFCKRGGTDADATPENPCGQEPHQPYYGFAERTVSGPRWTGRVKLIESQLDIPLRWRKPKRIFVCSMSDLWHEKLHLRDKAKVYAVMSFALKHTFLVLTKRPEERQAALNSTRFRELVECVRDDMWDAKHSQEPPPMTWPLSNVREGVSVENQATADERIPLLLQTPAAHRWISYEPALGAVDLTAYLVARCAIDGIAARLMDFLVAGGETGPGARPSHPDWFRAVRDQCAAAGVPFHFKSWGEWLPYEQATEIQRSNPKWKARACPAGTGDPCQPGFWLRAGSHSGRLLDGREHIEVME